MYKFSHGAIMDYQFTPTKRLITVDGFISCFERSMDDNYVFAGEMHDFWEIMYVEEGRICVSADENVLILNANDIIFHKPMELHKFNTEGKAKIFVMSFSLSGPLKKKLQNSSLTLSQQQKDMLYGIIKLLRDNSELSEEIYAEYENIIDRDPLICQQIASLCENFLISVCRDNTPIVDHPRSFETEMFRSAVLLMDEYIYDWISAKFIAKNLNVSVSYLKKIFSKYAGLGIHKYFLKSKITLACRLLRRGMSVCEVSEKLSFSSHNYFSTVFRRETGRLPSEFRKEK